MKFYSAIAFIMVALLIAFAFPAEAMDYGKMNHAKMGHLAKAMPCHTANEADSAVGERSVDGITKIFYSTQKAGFHQCQHQKSMGGKMGMNCMCGGMRSCNPVQDKPGSSIGSGGVDGDSPLSLANHVLGGSSPAFISSQILTSFSLDPQPRPPRSS